jgi:NAD+ kinase
MDLERIYIVANTTKPGALRALADLKVWCQEHRIEALPADEPVTTDVEGALVLALGGDGTVLRAASLFVQTVLPILGINLGCLGFLTQGRVATVTSTLESVLADEFEIEERMRLFFSAEGLSGSVLNDLVITAAVGSHFCDLDLSWGDGVVASYPGDGLILVTATGSTAYSLSAGGPVIVPPAACILATPLAVHKLGLRPVIFPPDEVLRVRVRTPVQLIGDGDSVGQLPEGSEVLVRRDDRSTHLVRPAHSSAFFHVLNEKLNWADSKERPPLF